MGRRLGQHRRRGDCENRQHHGEDNEEQEPRQLGPARDGRIAEAGVTAGHKPHESGDAIGQVEDVADLRERYEIAEAIGTWIAGPRGMWGGITGNIEV